MPLPGRESAANSQTQRGLFHMLENTDEKQGTQGLAEGREVSECGIGQELGAACTTRSDSPDPNLISGTREGHSLFTVCALLQTEWESEPQASGLHYSAVLNS